MNKTLKEDIEKSIIFICLKFLTNEIGYTAFDDLYIPLSAAIQDNNLLF